MKLLILAVGDKMPEWVASACAEYLKRMPREARVELVEIRPEKRSGQPVDKIKAAEAARLLDKFPKGARLVALDERGAELTTKELAERLSDWLADGRDTALVIGGADGLAPEVLARAEMKLALSRFTLPHGLARVLLAEQLYRSVSLLQGHPYHRE